MRRFRRGRSRLVLLALGLAPLSTGCNLYEGRSLDLFPTELDLSVECRDSQDCPKDRKLCAGGTCVECLLDSHCDPRHPACLGNACVECRANAGCGPGQTCNSVLNVCASSCTLDDQCTGPATPRCSGELDLCVQCVEDADCKGPGGEVCDRGGRCVGCRSDADCSPDAGRPACLPSTQRCEQCNGDEQCAPDQSCELPAGRCAPKPMPMPMPATPPGP